MTKATKPTETTEVAVLAVSHKEYGIEESKALELTGDLPQKLKERAELVPQYNEILKMDIEAPETAKKATELRKLIKNNRTKGIEVWHSNAKNYFLRGGQFVDAIRRAEVAVNLGMEEALESIEKYAENKAKEAHEAKTQNRIAEVAKYATIDRIEFEFMGDDSFNAFISGLKADFERKQEEERKAQAEREENERLDKLEYFRKLEIAPYAQFISDSPSLRTMHENEYQSFLKSLKKAKIDYEAEQEKQRIENERLKAEAERKEKELQAEREKQSALQAQIDAKQAKEAKEKAEREEAERKSKLEAEKLAKAPIKKQLKAWVESFELPPFSAENKTSNDIFTKFEAFKNWAKAKIDNHE